MWNLTRNKVYSNDEMEAIFTQAILRHFNAIAFQPKYFFAIGIILSGKYENLTALSGWCIYSAMEKPVTRIS